jgi:hypothetical protein
MTKQDAHTVPANPTQSIFDTSQIIAIGIAISYICGFIQVTSYLGAFGIKEYDALRTQYIVSGATFLLILGIYYFFVGRHIPTLDEDTNKYQDIFLTLGAKGKFWDFCGFTFALWELGFLIVVATIVGSSLLFTITISRTIVLLGPMLAGYILFDIILTSKAAESVGKSFWLLLEVFYIAVFVAFYYLADGIQFEFLQAVLIFTGCGFIALHSAKAVNSSKSKKIYLVYIAAFGLVASSGAFGRYFYGHVRASIGGGEPEQVRVVINDTDTPQSLQKELKVSDSISSKVNLIAQTDTEIFLGFPFSDQVQGYKTVIKLNKELVKAVIANDLEVIKHTKAK